jgi:hypothetical protein
MNNKSGITITGDHIYYALVFVVAILIGGYHSGWFDQPDGGGSNNGNQQETQREFQTLTVSECNVIRDAIHQTIEAIPMGLPEQSVAGVITVLRSYLPQRPRDTRTVVVNELTRIFPDLSLESARDQLTAFESYLPN